MFTGVPISQNQPLRGGVLYTEIEINLSPPKAAGSLRLSCHYRPRVGRRKLSALLVNFGDKLYKLKNIVCPKQTIIYIKWC